MSVLALIPARSGSKGIPGKNWRRLGWKNLIAHAYDCAMAVPVDRAVVSCDVTLGYAYNNTGNNIAPADIQPFIRPAELATDTTPMIDVVRHALGEIPGEPEQIIVLLQPTQPFRKPEHVREAIRLLQETGADSVVSVVELPKTHHPLMLCEIEEWPGAPLLVPWHGYSTMATTSLAPQRGEWSHVLWQNRPTRRQDVAPAYRLDGTVYAFRRATVARFGTIYGQDVRPLIIAPEDTCELDTESDWREAEARWQARHAQGHIDKCGCGHTKAMHPIGLSENLIFSGRCNVCQCDAFRQARHA